jgi:hypothetical protein
MGVRIHEPQPLDTSPSDDIGPEGVTGRAYLHALSRRSKQRTARRIGQDALAARVRAAVQGVALDQRVQYVDAPDLISVSHLIGRDLESRYRGLVEAFAEASGYVAHVTGPWPPYSFSDA